MRAVFLYLTGFLTDGIPYVLITLPFYLILRSLYLSHQKKKRLHEVNTRREVVMFFYFVFMILLFTQTFIVNPGINDINLVPFRIIITQIANRNYSYEANLVFILNIIGNIGIFVPVGMFVAYLFRTNFIKTALAGLCTSLFIEIVQLPLERTSDVDDLILNTVGAVIGYVVYKMLYLIYFRMKNHSSGHQWLFRAEPYTEESPNSVCGKKHRGS